MWYLSESSYASYLTPNTCFLILLLMPHHVVWICFILCMPFRQIWRGKWQNHIHQLLMLAALKEPQKKRFACGLLSRCLHQFLKVQLLAAAQIDLKGTLLVCDDIWSVSSCYTGIIFFCESSLSWPLAGHFLHPYLQKVMSFSILRLWSLLLS